MTRISFTTARDGSLTALVGSRSLHSRFDPIREAERFAAEQISSAAPPSTVVLIGAALGYAIDALRRRAPEAKIVSFTLDDELARRARFRADLAWAPGAPETVAGFLDRAVSDLDAASIVLLEWPPARACFPDVAGAVTEAVATRVRRAAASLATQGGFGRRWLRNRVRNYVRADPVRSVMGSRRIGFVAVVAAGPTLERSLPRIAPHRDRLALWVTGSALEAVVRHGLRPDLVLVTDAGFHAAEHLRPMSRLEAGARDAAPVVAAPLTASPGAFAGQAQLVLCEGELLDDRVPGLRASMRVSPHGTVTASAVLLARSLTAAPIVLLGADFAWLESRSHVRPHLSHDYRACSSRRLEPLATLVYGAERASTSVGDGWRTDAALQAYAGWFREIAFQRYSPIHALCASPMLADDRSLLEIDPAQLPARYPSLSWRPATVGWPGRGDRGTAIRTVLSTVTDEVVRATAPAGARELEVRTPQIAELAVRLALPELLRWSAAERVDRTRRWAAVRDRVVDELRDASRIVA